MGSVLSSSSVCAADLLRVGAGLRDGVAGGALIGAQFVLIQHGDQVAGVHALAVVHRQADDAAGDLAAHHHFVAVHGAGEDQSLRARALLPPDGEGDDSQQREKDHSAFHAETSEFDCKPNHLKLKVNRPADDGRYQMNQRTASTAHRFDG